MLDVAHVQESLRRLSATHADVFGANGHHFQLNSVLDDMEILAFEQRHGIHLPAHYRDFLANIGNGGAGPYYGVFSLGKMDGIHELKPWSERDGFIGMLSEPFPLTHGWNDLSGKPADELADVDEDLYEKQFGEFERRYFDAALVSGAFPICQEGCALRIWLVVSGPEAGRLWRDTRAEYTGINPLCLQDESRATFSQWYGEWLNDALRLAGLI
jgi:hypothetical protein